MPHADPVVRREYFRAYDAARAGRPARVAAAKVAADANYRRMKPVLLSRYRRNMVDLRALKLLRGCIDCGYDANADALQFDHVRGTKSFNVTAAAMAGTERMIVELAKCDVRCANCHSIITQQRRRSA